MKSIARAMTNDVFHPETLVLKLSVNVVGQVIINRKFNNQITNNGTGLALRCQVDWCMVRINPSPLGQVNISRLVALCTTPMG